VVAVATGAVAEVVGAPVVDVVGAAAIVAAVVAGVVVPGAAAAVVLMDVVDVSERIVTSSHRDPPSSEVELRCVRNPARVRDPNVAASALDNTCSNDNPPFTNTRTDDPTTSTRNTYVAPPTNPNP
jgi:hypothetical protein